MRTPCIRHSEHYSLNKSSYKRKNKHKQTKKVVYSVHKSGTMNLNTTICSGTMQRNHKNIEKVLKTVT